MPQIVTTTQLNQYLVRLQSGNVNTAINIYGDLLSRGYNYAGWAQGVAAGNSIAGQSALDFLSGTALMGLGGESCKNLSESQLNQIKIDMAKGYVSTLLDIAKSSGGEVNRDVSYKETRDFHEQTFLKNGLSIENWTLNSPMELIRRDKGDQGVESSWQRIRETGGNGFDAIIASVGLANIVGQSSFSPNPDIQKIAADWMSNVPGVANWNQIARFIDIYLSSISGFDFYGDPFTGMPWPGMDTSVNTLWNAALNWRPQRDPLAIDLDGDGIETVGISSNPILFDHDANGVKTGTGWLNGDDAWLVLDRNGNGLIDSGRELFGVDTQVTTTQTVIGADGISRQQQVTTMAQDGFAALRTLDSNSDGIFNASDAAFSQVRLWQDLNQDGISQANELSTLTTKGIASVSLAATWSNTNLGNGNTVTAQATVTRTNGTTTKIDGVSVSTNGAGNLNLADNPFYRQFSTTITHTAQADSLPEMRGSGLLRDLREAMSLGTPQAQALVTAVQQFSAATSRDQQRALAESVLIAWSKMVSRPRSEADNVPGTLSYSINNASDRNFNFVDAIKAKYINQLN